jgi:acyl-CoA synthetase (AMP-forming)/AMP-acid ligase II
LPAGLIGTEEAGRMTELARAIVSAEKEFAHRTAVVDGNRRLTFGTVADRSDRAAHVLAGLTGGEAANVALLVGNAAEAVELDLACVKAGLGRVSLNPRLTDDERTYIVGTARARVLVYGADFTAYAEALSEADPDLVLLRTGGTGPGLPYEESLARARPIPSIVECEPDRPSLIMFTSGTTGRPKGAVWTVGSRRAAVRNMLLNELDRAAAVGLVHAGSVSHGSGSKIVPVYLRGGTNIMMRRFEPGAFFRVVHEERATASFMVPTMVQMLVDEADSLHDEMASMVQISYGGARMPLQTIQAALDRFGKVFAQVYGSCEAPHPVLILPRHEHVLDDHVLSVAGRRSLGARLRFGDPTVEPEPGATGELLVGGPHIFGGYFDDPTATDAAMSGQFYKTGDVATLHAGGYVEIVGRTKDLIISGGFNVYPAEVERVLLEHPGVTGACVYGVPDARWGEQVVAAITVAQGRGLEAGSVVDTARAKLAGYKVPRMIRIVDQFPVGSTGKVLRAEVRRTHPEPDAAH